MRCFVPMKVVVRSVPFTLRSTRGLNAMQSSAWRLRSNVASVSAPPLMKSHAGSGNAFFASATISVVVKKSPTKASISSVMDLWRSSPRALVALDLTRRPDGGLIRMLHADTR
jgi:hypothetical protein